MGIVQKHTKIVYPELSYKLGGILFKVRKELGRFRNEQQYCDAIETWLKDTGIHYEREKILPPSFRGETKSNPLSQAMITTKRGDILRHSGKNLGF